MRPQTKRAHTNQENPRSAGEGYKAAGTMAHLWWDCPIIKKKKHWKEFLQLTKEITNKVIPEDPWTCLFHGVDGPIKQYKASIIPSLINVT